jgi:putative addiction module killer protein
VGRISGTKWDRISGTRKWFRGIGEYVIDWGPGYRVYIARDGETLIVLFGGSTKRGQQKAIDRAIELYAEYKARKRALGSPKVR